MHFSAILLAALSAGAHSLPTADPTIGGDLASSIDTWLHYPAIGIFSTPTCDGKETHPPLNFDAAGCYPFESDSDTVGINWGNDDSGCGINVYTDPGCANFATHTLTGDSGGFTCMSMSANGGPWRSLAIAECYPDAKTDNPGVPEAEG